LESLYIKIINNAIEKKEKTFTKQVTKKTCKANNLSRGKDNFFT